MSKSPLQFYKSPGEAWDVMYAACQQAKSLIEFDQYIIQNDEIGNKFLTLFRDKAREGVKIHLLLDNVGSRAIIASTLIAEIRAAGGVVHFYNPMAWWNIFKPRTWFPRNHCKTLLIDSEVAFIGSVCIDESMRHWRDTHVRCEGIIVADIEKDFARRWRRAQKRWPKPKVISSPKDRPFRYVLNHPMLHTNPIYRELLHEVKKAKSYVYIVTPYFIPPLRLRRALRKAVKRGVDVRVMMSEHSDVRIADNVAHSYFPMLLRRDIRIFLYRNTVLHAKYTTIDGAWATVGSTNIDYLSLWRNREANLITTEPATVAELRHHFEQDLLNCIEAEHTYWDRLPWQGKLLGYAGRLIKRIL